MNAADAKKIYEKHWCYDFISIEDTFTHIENVAKNGNSGFYIYIDSFKSYNELKMQLSLLEYKIIEHKNQNDYTGILFISWT